MATRSRQGGCPCPAPGCDQWFKEKHHSASHAWQFHDRYESYEEALEAVSLEDSGTSEDDPAGDDDDRAGRGGESGEGGTPTAGAERDENPLLLTPPNRADAGRPTCPECGDPLDRIGAGMSFEGIHEGSGDVAGRTERDDRYCERCEVVRTQDGTVIEDVRFHDN